MITFLIIACLAAIGALFWAISEWDKFEREIGEAE